MKFRQLTQEGGQDVTQIAQKAVKLSEHYLIANSEQYLEAYSNYSSVFFQQQEFETSRSILIKIVERIDIDLLSEREKSVYSSILNNLGVSYFCLQNFIPAAKYMVKSYNLKKSLGCRYYDLTGLVQDISVCYLQIGDAEKAKSYWLDLTDIAEKEFGKNSYDYLDSLGDLFNFLADNGFDIEANELDVEYTDLESRLNSERLSGRDYDQAVKDAINLYNRGDIVVARRVHAHIVASTPPLPDPILAVMGHTLDPLAIHAEKLDEEALKLESSGNYARAIRLYEVIIEILSTSLGKDNLRVGHAFNNLGYAKILAGDLSGAKTALTECLRVINLPLNRRNPNRGKMIENYARFVYERSLEYAPEIDSAGDVSREYAKRNVPENFGRSIRLRIVIPEDNEPPVELVIRSFEARIVFYESIGNYETVLRLQEDIVELSDVYYIFDPEKCIEARMILAERYTFHEKLDQAEKIYLSILAFVQENLPADHIKYILILYTTGVFYSQSGNSMKGSKFLEKALAVSQQLPERNKELEYQLKKNLIVAYYRNQHQDATELVREMLEEFDPGVLTDPVEMQDFGSYYAHIMEFEKAEPLYKKALATIKDQQGEWNLNYALGLSNLANLYRFQQKFNEALPLYQQSLRIREAELGPDHSQLNSSLSRLALTFTALNQVAPAIEAIKRIIRIDDRTMINVFRFGSHEQKLAFLEEVSLNTDLCMSVIVRFAKCFPGLPALGVNLAQKRKTMLGGWVLTRDFHGPDDAERAKLEAELVQLKRAIASAHKFTAPDLAILAVQRLAELEKLLNVQPVIPKDDNVDLLADNQEKTAGLEILRIHNYQFCANIAAGEAESVDHYIAFVYITDSPDEIKLVDFGPAKLIDENILRLRNLIRQKEDISYPIAALSALIIDPLIEDLRRVENLIICPDGDISLLPFDLLQYGEQALIDRFVISRADKMSAFRQSPSTLEAGEALIIAHPDYFAFPNFEHSKPSNCIFSVIDGTLQEGMAVASTTHGRLVTGEEASKEFLQTISSPVILHIATHAFYGRNVPNFENMPLLKSGLALAGANNGSAANAGIMFAEEISLLDLALTELVVLSACDTAQGEAIGKEGIFGLEKAFKAAGAKRIIVTLWEVPDRAAALLMDEFYRNMYTGNNVAVSLTLAKRTLREKMPAPIYWSSFVLNGDTSGFNLP